MADFWWDASENAVGQEAAKWADAIERRQSRREHDALKALRLYSNLNIHGIKPWQHSSLDGGRSEKVTYNVVQSIIESLYAKITKNTPKATFLTKDGLFQTQRMAKRLDRFAFAQLYHSGGIEALERSQLDSMIFRLGVTEFKVDRLKKDSIRAERVFPLQLLVDGVEAAAPGGPRTFGRVRYEHVDNLIAWFPKHADKIRAAAGSEASATVKSPVAKFREVYHLAIGDTPGRYVALVDDHLLEVDEWKYERPPFVFQWWIRNPMTWDGMSVVDQIAGIQYGLNYIQRQIHESLPWAVPKLFAEIGVKIALEHLNDVPGGIVRHAGNRPVIDAARTIVPELFMQQDRLYNRAFEVVGESQMHAQSKKPADVEAGVALRELSDIASERFAAKSKGYERAFLDATEWIIELGRVIGKSNPKWTTLSLDRRRAVEIPWEKVDLDRDKYVIQIWPTSMLPHTPAGRLQMVSDLQNLGYLDRENAMRLLNFPDLDPVMRLTEAGMDNAHWLVDTLIDEGKYVQPEPYQHLSYLLQVATAAYLELQPLAGVPKGRLDLLDRLIRQVLAMLENRMAAAPAPGAGGEMPAAPGPAALPAGAPAPGPGAVMEAA